MVVESGARGGAGTAEARRIAVSRTAMLGPAPGDTRWMLTPRQRNHLVLGIVLTAWSWAVLPRILQTLTASKARNSVGEITAQDSRIADLAEFGLTGAVLALCVLAVALGLRDVRARPLTGLVVLLAPWFYLVLRDLFSDGVPERGAVVYPALVGALWVMGPSIDVLRWVGAACAAALLFSVALGAVWPAKGLFFFSSGDLVLDDKATLSVGILIGFLTHGNNLGAFAVLSLPLIGMIKHPWARLFLLATAGFALFWSASRASFGAAAVCLLALVAVAALSGPLKRSLGVLVALAPWGLVVAVPLVTDDPSSFTNRGFIWAQSLAFWRTEPWLGLGSGWYGDIGSTSERIAKTAFHGHNQFVHSLTTGGLVLVALLALVIVQAAWRAGRLAARGHAVGIIYVATLGGVCVLERVLSVVDSFNMFPVAALPLIVIILSLEAEPPRLTRASRTR